MILATVAAALAASACANNDDEFAIDRETATVWLVSPTPLPDQGQEELDLLVDVFNWPHTRPFEDTFLTLRINGIDWNRRGFGSPNGKGGLGVSALDNTWSYATDEFMEDQQCFECTPLPFSEEEALDNAKQKLTELGLNLDDLSLRTVALPGDDDQPIDVLVIASLQVGGVNTDVKWTISYRNAAGNLASAGGHFVTTSELGEVPILTPEEALTLAGREATPETIAEAELTLETQFDRDTNQRILIPVYSVPVTENLDVDVTIAATRQQDIPYPDNDA